jgi:hypothetical protein
MTFAPEWFSGNQNLVTDNFMYKSVIPLPQPHYPIPPPIIPTYYAQFRATPANTK